MSTQESPTPPPNRDDELARLYLAGRDVPCPKCGYNRRDSDQATCPECAHALTLAPGSATTYAAAGTATLWLFVNMIVFGSIGTAITAFAIFPSVAYGINVVTLVIFAVLAAAFLTPLAFGIGGLRVLRRPLRHGSATRTHIARLRTAGIVFLISMLTVVGAPFLAALFF